MSDEKVVVQSNAGEVRIEATLNGDQVEFRTYILNSRRKEYDLGKQPRPTLSKSGCSSYFTVRLKHNLATKLDSFASLAGQGERLVNELVQDMQE